MDTVYQFTVQDTEGNQKNLSDYKGKVLLIVNTASRCGFTPQYEELEAMYSELKSKGLEIPLFTWLKAQKGFEGFEPTATAEKMLPRIKELL